MAVTKHEHASTQLQNLKPTAQPEAIQAKKTGTPVAEAAGRKLQFAHLVSRILHPFVASPLAIVLILWLDQGNFWAAIGWAGLCAAFVVVPGILYLRQKLEQKQYSDADVSVREQRYGFYIFGASCMLLCFLVLIWLQAPAILLASFSAALAAILAAAVINRFWTKISIHAGTMAGVAVLAAFYSWPLALLLGFGALLVSWARLVTKRHTLLQTVLGWAVAASCVGVVVGLAGLLN